VRVARSRELVAKGYALATVARVLKVTRQAIYRTPKPRAAPQRRPPVDDVEAAIVQVAEANPTDGYRMVWALTRRKLGRAVNRKRVLREHRLIQRPRSIPRRRRPGFFKVTRPAELWHMDMTAIWVAEHGWVYLNAIIDCCTREIVGWGLGVRCRATEAIAVVEQAVSEQQSIGCCVYVSQARAAIEHALLPDVATRAGSIATAMHGDGAQLAAQRLPSIVRDASA
jgi:putative transposase